MNPTRAKAKNVLWVLLFTATVGIAPLAYQEYWRPTPPLIIGFAIFYAVHPIGAAWMIYQSIRYESRPLPIILFCLVPYSFVWYYFERVRSGKQSLRQTAGRAPAERRVDDP